MISYTTDPRLMQQAATSNSGFMAQAGEATPTPPATIASASTSLDELNARLSKLSAHCHELASMIGGPMPCEPQSPEKEPGSSVVQRLNTSVKDAHNKVAHIEQAIAAMVRALGA